MILEPSTSDAPALLSPAGATLSHAELRRRAEAFASSLRAAGATSGDRVAFLLPSGPELAVALIGAMSTSVAVPLNPAFTAAEREDLLRRLGARFLVTEDGLKALDVAPRPADGTVLLVLTSGTTARPKAVRITAANIRARSRAFGEALGLGPADRCLNVVSFFHVHGLLGALLPALEAGGSAVCAEGFHAPSFAGWLRDFAPTWFTAGPALLRDILRAAPAAHALRFIRSVSAPLPPSLLAELERAYGVPVLEGYGMTETGTITSNPPPPRPRKAGTVGVPVGCEIKIADGEVLVRGPSVTPGYVDGEDVDGWFRTGDLGRLDADGYLTLTGRLKELINRGGEKVAPLEVEMELLRHPAVAEAVVFPLPHPRLGEDVGAAVVARAAVTEGELRRFAAERLAPYKVPARIGLVKEIPRAPSGKIARARMADLLGWRRPEHVAPATETERGLAKIWTRVLGAEGVGALDSFYDLGGDSMLAAELIVEIEAELGRHLPAAALLRATTLRALAAEIDAGATISTLALVQRGAGRPPFFCVHGLDGNVVNFKPLAEAMGADQPFYSFQAKGLDGREAPLERIEDMARLYLDDLLREQPRGPYHLGGWSFGGLVALEMARRLRASGREVALLAILDSRRVFTMGTTLPDQPAFVEALPELDDFKPGETSTPSSRLRARFSEARRLRTSPFSPEFVTRRRIEQAAWRASRCYSARPYGGKVSLIWSTKAPTEADRRSLELWERIAEGGVELFEIDCDHFSVMRFPQLVDVGRKLREWMDANPDGRT
jgi:acyl-CoA synthetase (AMP-forming)/AMP-acid ligase II/thioesterase domain-containing protein/acyl carrier protein